MTATARAAVIAILYEGPRHTRHRDIDEWIDFTVVVGPVDIWGNLHRRGDRWFAEVIIGSVETPAGRGPVWTPKTCGTTRDEAVLGALRDYREGVAA